MLEYLDSDFAQPTFICWISGQPHVLKCVQVPTHPSAGSFVHETILVQKKERKKGKKDRPLIKWVALYDENRWTIVHIQCMCGPLNEWINLIIGPGPSVHNTLLMDGLFQTNMPKSLLDSYALNSNSKKSDWSNHQISQV